ncbi:MAG TPA: type II CAAX endopeptidase family protein [bacterium]|mgnify:FL=1|nr:type II CAAX endopeptidase family protein [bacterium]
MNEAAKNGRQALAIELAAVTGGVLFLAHALYLARGVAIVGKALPTIVAVLLIYAPVAALWFRGRPVDFLDSGWRRYLRSLIVFLVASAVVFPLFLLAAHGWQRFVLGMGEFHAAGMPQLFTTVAYQLILVALPEEFFFRGYFQSTMNRIFPRPWRFLGANLGWGFVVTAAIFAFAHSVIFYRWWHFSIFFPALVFGYLRERTGSITAPVLFHAASNLLMDWIVRSHVAG